MPKKIVLATIGSLGDVHPFIALGLALKAKGFDVIVAAPEDNVPKIERAGLQAAGIYPPLAVLAGRLGLDADEAAHRMTRDPDYLFRKILFPMLPDVVKQLNVVAEGASAIAGPVLTIAGEIVAEMRGIPFIPCVLQPFSMLSAYDAPNEKQFWMMARPPMNGFKIAYNKAMLSGAKLELRRRYSGTIDRVRRQFGLGKAKAFPLFGIPDAPLVLGLYSERLGPAQPDYPSTMKITGYPVFDSDTGGVETLDAELVAFLGEGEPPIVFTLGSFAVHAPGDFYRESAIAARKLGRRALLLSGQHEVAPQPGLLARPYAPHSLVFPFCAAIVHHGGVGTTGAALRAGRPQLVVPFMGDQPDNAARITRLGLGATIPWHRYTAARAATTLGDLLADSAMAQRARDIAPDFIAENGAGRAAEEIARVLA